NNTSLLVPLLFYYHFQHLHLTPFPTRRSSDLPGSDQVEHQRGPGLGQRIFGHRASGVGLEQRELRRQARGILVRRHLEPVAGDGDRKSTRLNSSHRTISYAVFCLKKKK